MPGRDGYAVAAHVKATPALAHIPVLLLAGAFEPVDEARVAETGCAGVLVKPFEPQMVISRVRTLLAERRTRPTLAAGEGSAPRPGGEAATIVPALVAPVVPGGPPPAAPQTRTQSVDDYFERLDAAFASLNAQLDDTQTPQAATRPGEDAPAAAAPPPALAETPATTSSEPPAGVPLSIADAFDALLGVEQGAAPPVLPDAWMPVVTDDLVEQVARRIAEHAGDRIVRDLAPRIVSEVAERLVREEIARIRAEAEAGDASDAP